MMHNVNLEFSESRGTWNVFVDDEWVYESPNYERAENIFNSYFWEEE